MPLCFDIAVFTIVWLLVSLLSMQVSKKKRRREVLRSNGSATPGK